MYSKNWSLPTEEIFKVRGQNRPVASLPSSIFVFSRANAITKATEYVTFRFSSFPSRKVWTLLSVSDNDFSVFYQP